MDQAAISQAIDLLTSGNLSDDDDVRKMVEQSLRVLDEELRSVAFTPLSVGPPAVFDSNGSQLDTREVANLWLSRVSNLQESARGLRRLSVLEHQTKESLAIVRDSQNDIEQATVQLAAVRADLVEAKSEHAQFELASQFKKLSRVERATSWVFRICTFALLGAAVWVAWLASQEAQDWANALGHLAVVLAVGSAAAYTARLASTHGTTADWAKSVQVQLLTFKDFLNAIEDPAVKHRVYEEFGRRVLGSPPGKGDEAAPLPTSQLLELANVIAAARKNS